MSRVAALAFGLTFYVTAGMDVLGLHECPHHDAVALASEPQEGPVHGHGHGAHAPASGAPSGGSHGAHGDHGEHGGHQGHEGPCTCVGTCQLGGHAHLGPAADGIIAQAVPPIRAVRAPGAGDATRLPGTPDFYLPLSTAPPGLGTQSV